ncbi:hypothetical protein EV702DRAFT_1107539 [Suillus placidus]|uniref:Uncharacterized protein n=1 Tax=Suillus placidus TaxID=48579 RepID=A0A9P6ZTQ1_9AGAM|nr:hypothetical protein EV702DRAFT_1107539 [Suillus placidus]
MLPSCSLRRLSNRHLHLHLHLHLRLLLLHPHRCLSIHLGLRRHPSSNTPLRIARLQSSSRHGIAHRIRIHLVLWHHHWMLLLILPSRPVLHCCKIVLLRHARVLCSLCRLGWERVGSGHGRASGLVLEHGRASGLVLEHRAISSCRMSR